MARKTVVRSQMPSGKLPSMTPKGGVYDRNQSPTFGKPHDTGRGGIPLKFGETIGKAKVPKHPSYTDR